MPPAGSWCHAVWRRELRRPRRVESLPGRARGRATSELGHDWAIQHTAKCHAPAGRIPRSIKFISAAVRVGCLHSSLHHTSHHHHLYTRRTPRHQERSFKSSEPCQSSPHGRVPYRAVQVHLFVSRHLSLVEQSLAGVGRRGTAGRERAEMGSGSCAHTPTGSRAPARTARS